ncbi:hypothetical protein GCK72_007048 [Caenorhabditis remanei]|uniref:Uncharacterized protein n=1 Tax=Caenorhabditis remanei TaxID=31234 RepID=A0A6A5HGF9_CAERE|nr:hypothetical protein GCK72_007048 [Caenorhabditis remanei]KAF1767090.1 hypothetical protein GCK72_007048 [Caenorhabditis remanei]
MPNSINLFPLYQTLRQALINHNQKGQNQFVFVCKPPDNRPLSAMFPNNFSVTEDSSAIASAINDLVQAIQGSEQAPNVASTSSLNEQTISTSPTLDIADPETGEIPCNSNEESNNILFCHFKSRRNRKVRAREKNEVKQFPPLTEGTSEFKERFEEAKQHFSTSVVYLDPFFCNRANLFNPRVTNSIPQKVGMMMINAKTLYWFWRRSTAIGFERKTLDKEWEDIKKEKGTVYWEWIGREIQLHDEFVVQLRKGFIRADSLK